MDSLTTLEVFQREYAFGLLKNGNKHIRTTQVETCVVWCGVDDERKVGFLFHIDWPCFTKDLPEKLDELLALVKPNTKFNSFLWGGRKYCKSHRATRLAIRKIGRSITGAKFRIYEKGLSPMKKSGDGYMIDIESGIPNQCAGEKSIRTSKHDIWNDYRHIFSSNGLRKAPRSA